MRERPILMSAPMVQPTLSGAKRKTRRLIPPSWFGQEDHEREYPYNLVFPDQYGDYHSAESLCRYGQPGDHLWVRESFYQAGHWDYDDTTKKKVWCGSHTKWYAEEEGNKTVRLNTIIRKIPSIHMPRWASRITLEIISIRVERLEDISNADCIAEGISKNIISDHYGVSNNFEWTHWYNSPKLAYIALWERINGAGSWERDRQKFAWVIEFKDISV